MKIRTMKLLDEKVGPWVCLLFHFYNSIQKILFRKKSPQDPDEVKSIVLLKLFGMGSIILATPLMRALKKRFTRAKLVVFTFASNRDLCEHLEIIDEVVVIDSADLFKFVVSTIKTILYIRKKRCEISIDLEFFSKSSTLIQYLCGTPVRVGYYLIQIGFLIKMMWRGNLLTNDVYYNPHKHTVEAFLALGSSIGADAGDKSLIPVQISAEERIRLQELLKYSGIEDNDVIIAINVYSSKLCLERMWPLKNFVELAQKIQNYSSAKIIIIGEKEGAEYVNEFFKISSGAPGIVCFLSKLNIGMLAALLQRSKLLITNDSGPLHIASSLGVPTVSFFGPETPERFGPLGENHTVFYADIYCSPCINVFNQKIAPCDGKNICMSKITTEDVFVSIKERYLDR